MTHTELLLRLRDLHEELLVLHESNPSSLAVDGQTIEQLSGIVSRLSDLIDRSEVMTKAEMKSSVEQISRVIQAHKNPSAAVKDFYSHVANLMDQLCQ